MLSVVVVVVVVVAAGAAEVVASLHTSSGQLNVDLSLKYTFTESTITTFPASLLAPTVVDGDGGGWRW